MASATGRLAAISLALALVPAAAKAGPPADSELPPVDTISYVLGMWGHRVDQWVIRADGSGEIRSRDEASPPFRDPVLLVRRFQADPSTFRDVRALLRIPESYAERELPCGELGADAPGAELRWTFEGQGRQLGLSYGCNTQEAGQVYQAIRAADAIVRTRSGGPDGERHPSSELPDIHPARIVPRTKGEEQ